MEDTKLKEIIPSPPGEIRLTPPTLFLKPRGLTRKEKKAIAIMISLQLIGEGLFLLDHFHFLK